MCLIKTYGGKGRELLKQERAWLGYKCPKSLNWHTCKTRLGSAIKKLISLRLCLGKRKEERDQ